MNFSDFFIRRPIFAIVLSLLIVIAGLSVVTVAITVWAGPLFALTLRAAQQLLHRDDDIQAVLRGGA